MSALRRFLALAALVLGGCATVGPPQGPVTPSDRAREQRLADEIVPGLVVGEAVQIESEGRRFLGLLTRGAGKPKGPVILVHGMGVHPDFGVIGALRAELADRGYTTLSIQMPVLAADAQAEDYVGVFDEAAARLSTAVRFLAERGHRRPAVVSHSMGARMANHWLSRQPNQPISAWVPLAISSGELEALRALSIPVFDIYAEKDFEVVRKNAGERAAVLRRLRGSKQVMVYGADHYFTRKEKEVAVLLDQLLAPLYR